MHTSLQTVLRSLQLSFCLSGRETLRVLICEQGYGTLLLEEAERISAVEHRSRKLLIISGVGTRHYYRKLGYRLEGPYMVKDLPQAQRNSGLRHRGAPKQPNG